MECAAAGGHLVLRVLTFGHKVERIDSFTKYVENFELVSFEL